MKTKRVAHRIYRVEVKGNWYEIDGQNHEFDSKEWQLFVNEDNSFSKIPDLVWVETFPTKATTIEYLETL